MKTLRVRRAGAISAVVCVLVVTPPALGQAPSTQTFTTSQSQFTPGVRNQGWWSPTIQNLDSNDNYAVGSQLGDRTRNFFTFHLTGACAASGVTLELTRFIQSAPSLRYSLFDVSTPAAVLNTNTGASQAIFTDLGSGTTFGSFDVTNGPAAEVLRLPLNVAGVDAFNAARRGFFSLGGQSPAEETLGISFLFGNSGPGGGGTQQLVVTCLRLPTTTEECQNGGWRSYNVFKNQGDCVSFVATGGKNPPARQP